MAGGSSTLASLLGSGVYSSDGSLEVSGESQLKEAASGGDQRWPLFRSAMAEYDDGTNIPVSLLRSVVAAARRGEATAAMVGLRVESYCRRASDPVLASERSCRRGDHYRMLCRSTSEPGEDPTLLAERGRVTGRPAPPRRSATVEGRCAVGRKKARDMDAIADHEEERRTSLAEARHCRRRGAALCPWLPVVRRNEGFVAWTL
nr:hypothetical protein Iba_chr15eCG0030 [Ipomoea batatas]